MDVAQFPCTEKAVAEGLHRDGFHRFPALVDPERWRTAVSCPSGTVNYTSMRVHIDACLRGLNERLGWDCVMTKYRVSAGCSFDASNATDASALHRDVQQHGETNIPVFTLIVYLDKADLKLIGGSHRHHRMSLRQTLANRSEMLSFAGGDALLFHASLLHGGVFRTLHRRTIVQCFDIFPTAELAAAYGARIMHIWCPPVPKEERTGVLVARVSHMAIIAQVTQYLSYLIAARGYARFDRPDGVDAFSCEAWRPRLPPEEQWDDEFHRGNLYVMADKRFSSDAAPKQNSDIRHEIYNFSKTGTRLLFALTLAVVLAAIRAGWTRLRRGAR